MFLARETGWDHDTMMEMPIAELHWWVVEAVKLHNALNKSD
jgi:hypothetical protein